MKIVVNGVEKTLQREGQPLTYAGVCVLAGIDPDLNPSVTWAEQGTGSGMEIRPGAVLKLKRPHPGYSEKTLFLCRSVENDGISAKSHYGSKSMGPTLFWGNAYDEFEVVGYHDAEPAVPASSGALSRGQLVNVRGETVFNVMLTTGDA